MARNEQLPSSQATQASSPKHKRRKWAGARPLTERDVHRDFFADKKHGESQLQYVQERSTTADDLPAQESSDLGSSLWRKYCYSLLDHATFAVSLISKHVPNGRGFSIREWAQRVPAYHVCGVLVRNLLRKNSSHDQQEQPVLRPDRRLSNKVISSHFVADIFIGFSIGAMSIPQGMSYAVMAGLPYEYGLYNNLIHPFAYFWFGTSRHAITGVGAVENLMVGESLNNLVGSTGSVDARKNAAQLLSICSAVIFMIFRFTGMAAMADLLADPILSGFATAAAFLVATSQLKYAFGLTGLKSEWGLPKAMYYIASSLDLITMPSLLLCKTIISFCILLICQA